MKHIFLNLLLIASITSLVMLSSCKDDSPPVAAFIASETSIVEGTSVYFTDQSTNSPTTWSWDFGDGNTSSNQNPSHTYNSVGDYTVELTATNDYGFDTETKTNYIIVSFAPVAAFIASETSIDEGTSIAFTDQSTNTPTTWSWDFGDGSTSSNQNPSHTYNSLGVYTVELTATNDYGSDTETKTNYITVYVHGLGLTDTDGNTYTSIIIGTQEWMAENLKVTHYPNGDPIPLVTQAFAWGNLAANNTSDAYCYYSNNASGEANTYGALYTYAAAIGDDWQRDLVETQGVCPDGWHLPADSEWEVLETYLGTNAGSKLASNAALWTDGNLDQSADFGTSGFSAHPSGVRRYDDGMFEGLEAYVYWWSATEINNSRVYRRNLSCNSTDVISSNTNKSFGFSVRCVRDQLKQTLIVIPKKCPFRS